MIDVEEGFNLLPKMLTDVLKSEDFNFKILGENSTDFANRHHFIACTATNKLLKKLDSIESEKVDFLTEFHLLTSSFLSRCHLVNRSDTYAATNTGGVVKVIRFRIPNGDRFTLFLISPLCGPVECQAINWTLEFIFTDGSKQDINYFDQEVFVKMFLYIKKKAFERLQ